MAIVNLIKEYRIKNCLNQAEMAELLNETVNARANAKKNYKFQKQNIYWLEKYNKYPLDKPCIQALANIFNMSYEELMIEVMPTRATYK